VKFDVATPLTLSRYQTSDFQWIGDLSGQFRQRSAVMGAREVSS